MRPQRLQVSTKSLRVDIYLSILSRTYYKSPTTKGNVTNPGEFPWVAAIFDKSEQDQYRSLHIYISTLSMLSKYLHIYTIYAISISIFIHDIYITAGSLSSWAPVRSWTWTPWSRWDTRCSPSSVSHNISSAGHESQVTCHVSRVTCHVSRVTCPDRPGDLVVHLGDWDLRYDYSNKYEAGEEFPHIEVTQ